MARLQRTQAAYVNEGRGSAISRFAPPNDASPRHRQRRLREAPTASAAAAAAAAAAKHTRTTQEGICFAHTLHNICARFTCWERSRSSLFCLSCFLSPVSQFLLLCFLLSAFFFFFLFSSLFFLHITLRSLLSRSRFPQKLSCKASVFSLCVSNFFPGRKETFVYAFSFSFSFRCAFFFGVVLLFCLDLHMLLFSSSSVLSAFPSLFLSPLPG